MNSPIAYIGGKSKLAATITAMIPEHKTYCEAFTGGGWVFFKKEPSKYEVLNDLDSELISFYRVVQNHLEEFLKQFKWLLASREQFNDWMNQQKAGGLTDIQRAARYYYLQRLAYGGKVKGRSFGSPGANKRPGINLLRLEENMSEVYLRLQQVMIENKPYDEVLKLYDSPDTFFYCDPPYYKAPCYHYNMTMPDYEKMAGVLANLKGKFLLSINDYPEIREVFKAFSIDPMMVFYSIGKKNNVKARELLIKNY